MDEHDFLAEQFEENRTHLRAVAYRMLGSMSEVDDAVQEAWLRLGRSDTSEVQNLGGWLTTVVGGCAWTCCARAAQGARSPSISLDTLQDRCGGHPMADAHHLESELPVRGLEASEHLRHQTRSSRSKRMSVGDGPTPGVDLLQVRF